MPEKLLFYNNRGVSLSETKIPENPINKSYRSSDQIDTAYLKMVFTFSGFAAYGSRNSGGPSSLYAASVTATAATAPAAEWLASPTATSSASTTERPTAPTPKGATSSTSQGEKSSC